MTTRVLAVVLMALSVTSFDAGQAGSAAKPLHFVAHLNAAQMANIHSTKGVPADASGELTATLTGGTLTFTLTWAHLTSGVEHADVMLLMMSRKFVATLFPVCVGHPYCHAPAGGYTHWYPRTQAIERHWLLTGKMFVTISTARNPHGEIGGRIEPAKMA